MGAQEKKSSNNNEKLVDEEFVTTAWLKNTDPLSMVSIVL